MEILNRNHRAGLSLLRRLWWPALLLMLCAGIAGAGDGLPHWLNVITADHLRGDVGFLSSEELSGRAVLSPGSRTAASFIASRFQALGLKPAGEGDRDFFQEVPLVRARVHSGVCRVEREGEDQPALELAWGKDFRCRPRDVSGFDLTAEAVFAGYGIRAPDSGHDDYAGLEVEGRVMLVLAGVPAGSTESDDSDEPLAGRHGQVSVKRQLARSLGAKALLVLPSPGTAEADVRTRADFWPDRLAPAGEEEHEKDSCPAILLQEDAALRMLALVGNELVPGDGTPRALPGVRISCRLRMDHGQHVSTRNILGLIPGRDELHFREFIIVSAHYDHLGVRGEDRVFPGADDNASGVAAMLAAARALAALPPQRRPARSVLFVAWAGEERGFLGSEHFGRKPTVPRGQIKAMINLDMVGRNKNDSRDHHNTALAIYSAQATGLKILLREAAAAAGLDLRRQPRLQMGLNSDHLVFHRLGIPSVFFFTGLHGDYNRPTDTADKINYAKLLRVSQTAAGLAYLLADELAPPQFDDSITALQGQGDPF